MQHGAGWQDYDGDTVTFVLVGNVSNGTLALDSATGEFTYEPSAGFVGNDLFTYELSDGLGTSTYIATVFIAVMNNVPEPSDDGPIMVQCHCDDPDAKTGNVADNDGLTPDGDNWKDSDGDSVTFVLVDSVSNGTLDFDTATGEFKYVQNEGYIGDDSFTYKISDGLGTSTQAATVSLSVVAMIADATGSEVTGTFTVDGNATAGTAKGMFTPAGDTVERETTDYDFYDRKYYNKQYDGPSEFTVDYTIKLKPNGDFEPTGSTVKMTSVNYTRKKRISIRPSASVSAELQAQWESEGKTVLREPGNGKVYIYAAPELMPYSFPTLDIPITEATLVDGKLHSFKFNANAWYGEPHPRLIDKGIVGKVDLAGCKASFMSRYQDNETGVITTWGTVGKIKD